MGSGGKRDNPVGMQPRTWVRVVETPAGSASAVTVPRPATLAAIWRRTTSMPGSHGIRAGIVTINGGGYNGGMLTLTTWKTPATAYPEARVGKAEIKTLRYRGIYHAYGLHGHRFYQSEESPDPQSGDRGRNMDGR